MWYMEEEKGPGILGSIFIQLTSRIEKLTIDEFKNLVKERF